MVPKVPFTVSLLSSPCFKTAVRRNGVRVFIRGDMTQHHVLPSKERSVVGRVLKLGSSEAIEASRHREGSQAKRRDGVNG
jgi:hypothetical protein